MTWRTWMARGNTGKPAGPSFVRAQSAPFEFQRPERPIPVPKTMHSREISLFVKEATLAGWVVRKHSRRKMSVAGEGQTAIYRRTKKVWVLKQILPIELRPLQMPKSAILYKEFVIR